MNSWTSTLVESTTPRKRFLLVARLSGYVLTEWDYITAQYDPDYKGWVDPSNTCLTDSGSDPLYWTELPERPSN